VASSSRRKSLEREVFVPEGEFSDRLTAALRKCAAGEWGLFGQIDAVDPKLKHNYYPLSVEAENLMALGERIAAIRARLSFTESFVLHDRFMQMRRLRGANQLGEPRLAQELLRELDRVRRSKPAPGTASRRRRPGRRRSSPADAASARR
jgi:hypothetical protein